MATFLLSLAVVLLSILGLALGVLFGRAPLAGSCGGISCIRGTNCPACPRGRRT